MLKFCHSIKLIIRNDFHYLNIVPKFKNLKNFSTNYDFLQNGLLRAELLMNEQKYEKSEEVFENLIEQIKNMKGTIEYNYIISLQGLAQFFQRKYFDVEKNFLNCIEFLECNDLHSNKINLKFYFEFNLLILYIFLDPKKVI